MSIKLLRAMMSRPSSKGWFYQFGKKKYHRRERHIKSQMKFFGGPKFGKRASDKLWGFVRGGRMNGPGY